MLLEEFCNSLTDINKFQLALKLIRAGMPAWKRFAAKGKLSYRDSVVWMKHEVDADILENAVQCAEKYFSESEEKKKTKLLIEAENLLKEFEEPVTAMQDDDWKLPQAAEKFFYSVFNLLNALTCPDDRARYFYVSINQAIDAVESAGLLSEEEIKSILNTKP